MRRRAALRQAARKLSSESTRRDGVDDGRSLVGDDERLAVVEELCDAAAVATRSPACPAAAASAATMPKLSPAEASTNTSACG